MSHIIHSSFFWPRSGRKIFLAFLARIFENIHHFFIIFCAHFQKYSSFFHHFFFLATFLKNDNHFFVIFRSFINIFPSFLALFWWFWGVIFWGRITIFAQSPLSEVHFRIWLHLFPSQGAGQLRNIFRSTSVFRVFYLLTGARVVLYFWTPIAQKGFQGYIFVKCFFYDFWIVLRRF